MPAASSSHLSSASDFSPVAAIEEAKKVEEPLKKSRSLAFVMDEEAEKEKKLKKRRFFWSKLLHSKTMKDKSSAKLFV